MKRIFSLVIAFLLLLTACSGMVSEETTTVQGTETVAQTESETTREEIPDNLPERDFAGKAFRVISMADKTYETTVDEY
ncbi:MAG: hypothetical protein IJX14_04285, partial [Clostridia bacterium]|nr:hypothetical protein [Clostridia bacterium]